MIGDVIIGAVYLAILYSLVRPGSKSAALIADISKVLISVVGATTGYDTTPLTSPPPLTQGLT